MVMPTAADPVAREAVCREVETVLPRPVFRKLADAGYYAALEDPDGFKIPTAYFIRSRAGWRDAMKSRL